MSEENEMKTKTTKHAPGRCFDCIPGATLNSEWTGISLCSVHAAAPDLLEAAKEAWDLIPCPGCDHINEKFVCANHYKLSNAIRKAEGRAAIAKAEGQEVSR